MVSYRVPLSSLFFSFPLLIVIFIFLPYPTFFSSTLASFLRPFFVIINNNNNEDDNIINLSYELNFNGKIEKKKKKIMAQELRKIGYRLINSKGGWQLRRGYSGRGAKGGGCSWRRSHGDLFRRPRNNPRDPIIFYCDSTPTTSTTIPEPRMNEDERAPFRR